MDRNQKFPCKNVSDGMLLILFPECQRCHAVEFPEALDEVAWCVESAAVCDVCNVFARMCKDFL